MLNKINHYKRKKIELKRKCDSILRKYLGDIENDSFLLDIGGGLLGAFDDPVMDKLKRVTLDIDFDNLKNNETTNIKVCGDARILPFKNSSLDAAISRDCLEHIENVDLLFLELQRTMKKDGVFITLIPNYLWIVSFLAYYFPNKLNDLIWRIFVKKKNMPYPVYYEINTERKWKEFSKKYNFQIEHLEFYHEVSHWFLKFPSVFFWIVDFLQMPLKLHFFRKLRSTMLIAIKFNVSEK